MNRGVRAGAVLGVQSIHRFASSAFFGATQRGDGRRCRGTTLGVGGRAQPSRCGRDPGLLIAKKTRF